MSLPVPRTGKKVAPQTDDIFDNDQIDFDQIDDIINLATIVMVQTPAGASLPVMNQFEADHYNNLSSLYQTDNMFKNIADKLELDRLLTLEIMCFRWSNWLLQEKDYDGGKVNTAELQKNLDVHSKGILAIKNSLGIDKKNRDATNGGSIADYLANLQVRAAEFGVHRDKQNYKAFNLWKELQGKVTLYSNSTDTERTEFEAHAVQILEWIISKFPELDELDESFRKNQKIWLRELNK